jgi:hypothetical protein
VDVLVVGLVVDEGIGPDMSMATASTADKSFIENSPRQWSRLLFVRPSVRLTTWPVSRSFTIVA